MINHDKIIAKVINLDSRHDRLSKFHKNWKKKIKYHRFSAISKDDLYQYSYNFFNGWSDPILERPHTEGEIGCFLSHYSLWKECKNNNIPYLILEDDTYPVNDFNREFDKLIPNIYEWDIIYLAYMDMNPEYNIIINDDICIPGYPYWGCGYIITPTGARKLLNTNILDNMIPVDEYLPIMCGCIPPNNFKNTGVDEMKKRLKRFEKLNGIGLQNQIVVPFSRSELGSDIEQYSVKKPLGVTTEKLILAATVTERNKAAMLEETCIQFGYNAYFMGLGRPWTGGNMEVGRGGFQKVELLKEHLIDRELWDDDSILLVVDGYDVFLNDTPEEVLRRFYEMDADIVFAAEKECWPDSEISTNYPESETSYRFLNSGCFIGKASKIKTLISDIEGYRSDEDDQWFYHIRFLESKGIYSGSSDVQQLNIKLDTENYIFQCLEGAADHLQITENGQILNTETNCCTCIVHGNGDNKTVLKNLYYNNFSMSNENEFSQYFVADPKYNALSSDILEIDFLTPEGCRTLIELSEKTGSWEPLPGDNYPAQEKRLSVISPEMFSLLKNYLKRNIYPLLEDYWKPVKILGLADAFIIKYSMDGQRHLDCHNDTSLVTLSVKLNDDYQGAELVFYRQQFSNSSVEKGKALAWPGQVSHPHESTELLDGTKYSLTIWTARIPEEVK